MLNIPVLRWGRPYTSLETDTVVHFDSGEELAKVSRAVPGMVERDLRHAPRARDVLREIAPADLIVMTKRAADLYLKGTLPLGDGTQTPDDFVRCQSATTGLPEHMCRANMEKNHFVLTHMDEILDALTRGLDLSILARGYGAESRGVPLSFQAQSPVLGLVLPSNSPGVHTLWLPVIALQVGLVLKPGPQEPWTPYRMAQAFFEAGIPEETIAIYPGLGDVGAAVLAACRRSLIFGGTATVERYKSNPGVQVHGPGFTKILLGDDKVDDWERYLDVMVDSVLINSGRSCISCSGIWAARHTEEIADALAERLGPIAPVPPDRSDSLLAAFTVPGVAEAISNEIDAGLGDAANDDRTARFREGESRLVRRERCDYLRPTVIHAASRDAPLANKEYMFPFVSVVRCPQEQMLDAIGGTLVCTAITEDGAFRQKLLDATHVDRLNFGPVPTIRLNWLQPHEGGIIEFLFRPRAFQEVPSF